MTTAPAQNQTTIDAATSGGLVLVATDGRTQSDGALAVGRLLAAAAGSSVEVVAVQPQVAPFVPDTTLLLERDPTEKLTADLADRVRRQSARLSTMGTGASLGEPIITRGKPERVIASLASERDARLIVVGLGRHGVLDRIFGNETAVKVARESRVPVLAVPAEARTIPQNAVVGVDFSEGSLRAAQKTIELLSGGGVVHLVHVTARGRLVMDPLVSDQEYRDALRHDFVRFRARLVVPPNVQVTHQTVEGDAARELIAFAERQHADTIAGGSHGEGLMVRFVLGSVTSALLRAASCSVLVVPESDAILDDSRPGDATIQIDRTEWAAVLADFSRTNVGRRTRLELDDADIGAQSQETNYPLRGIAFDPHDERLSIMLGGLTTAEPHLTRNIERVISVDLLTDRNGNDVALRVRHGAGQTLLTFVPS